MKPTYIQRADEYCINILESWGITTQETPVSVYPEPKELSKRSWDDQDGDDVHYGDRAYYKSFQQKWKFIYIGAAESANENVRQFLLYLQNADFSIFSEYTMMGARCVYSGSTTDSFLRRGQDYWSFTVELTVIKPLSRGVYFGGLPTSIKAECDSNIYLANGDVKILKKNDVYITAQGIVFGIFIPLGVEEAKGGILDGNNVSMLARRTLSGVTDFASAYSAIKDMDLRYGEVGVSAYLDESMQPSVLMCIGINNNDPIPMATLSVVEALKTDYGLHKDNKAIHRTSAEIRREIVDADIPKTLARVKQLNDAIALMNGGATEQYNTLAKLQAKIESITSVLSGDDGDAIIETLQEALSFINEHQESIESLVGTYVAKTSIADNLTTSDAEKVLSAKQGVALKSLVSDLERNINTALGEKVDKVDGKELSSNNFSDEYKRKLDGVDTGANNYKLPAATGLAIGGVKPGEGLTVDPDGTIRVILNGVVDPSMMAELEEPTDADKLLAFRDKTTSHIFSLGGLFSWIKGKFTAPLKEGNKVAKFLVIDDMGNTSAIAENDIGALAEDRTAAKVRAVDDQGNSVNLTTAQTAALVLTDENKPRIQELAGIVPTRNYVSDGATLNTEYAWYSTTASSPNANSIGHIAEQLKIGDWVCLQFDVKTDGEVRHQINLGSGSDKMVYNTNGKFIRVFETRQIKTQAELSSLSLPFNGGGAIFSLWIESGTTFIKNRLIGIGNTPVDWFPAYGIDYSILTEQIMSGVFWPDINGVPKQVYARAFRGTTAPNYSIGLIIITPISESPIHTSCSLHMMVCNIKGTSTNTYEGVYLQNANKGLQLIMVDAASYSRRSQPFVAIVLYTK